MRVREKETSDLSPQVFEAHVCHYVCFKLYFSLFFYILCHTLREDNWVFPPRPQVEHSSLSRGP